MMTSTSSNQKTAMINCRFCLSAMSTHFKAYMLTLLFTPLLFINVASASTKLASDDPMLDLPIALPEECKRTSSYSIYLSGLHTGTMNRTETWQGDHGVITSKSQASILGIGTQYHQRAELSWSDNTNEWLTDNFHQKVSGFRSRDMQVTFDNNGLESRVDIDGDVDHYASKSIPLRDVDTLAIQIREHLLQGRQQFALIRQASDAIESYQYYVKEPQTAKIKPWGELMLIPVEQTGAEYITYYFSPAMDYQLIKARYHGMILRGLIELDSYHSTCDKSQSK